MVDNVSIYTLNKNYLNDIQLKQLKTEYDTLSIATKKLGLKKGQIKNFMIRTGMIKYISEQMIFPLKDIDLMDITVNGKNLKSVLLVEDKKVVKKNKINYITIYIRKDTIDTIKRTDWLIESMRNEPTKININGGVR